MQRNKLHFIAITIALVFIAHSVFAPYQLAQVRFVSIQHALVEGTSTLHVIHWNGYAVEENIIPVTVITRARAVSIEWKGNLPKGEIFLLKKNNPNASPLPPQLDGTDYLMIELPENRDGSNPESVQMVCVAMLQQVAQRSKKKIVLVEMRYPYGKNRVYLNGSQYVVGARLMELGHEVTFVDFNIDKLSHRHVQNTFKQAEIVGVSVIGAPYIPDTLRLIEEINRLKPPATPIILGGQVISNLLPAQFEKIYGDLATQIISDFELAPVLGCTIDDLQSLSPYGISYVPFLESLGDQRLKRYMTTEMTLVIGQGCSFACTFCAAEKDQKEIHVDLAHFESLLRFFATKARQFGIQTLKFYASALDFFQHPLVIASYLEAMARVQKETGVRFKMRALSCLTSFLAAYRQIHEFAELIQRSGLNSVGFGVDGTDEEIWISQNKRHNRLTDVEHCIDICHQMSVEVQILLVMGYQKENKHTLWKTFKKSRDYVRRSSFVVIRPFIAKEFVPGNEGWYKPNLQQTVNKVVNDPYLFYNLDFAACASSLTHPQRMQRWMCHASYLGIIAYHKIRGRCPNSPLLAQGEKGVGGFLAKAINRLLPITD